MSANQTPFDPMLVAAVPPKSPLSDPPKSEPPPNIPPEIRRILSEGSTLERIALASASGSILLEKIKAGEEHVTQEKAIKLMTSYLTTLEALATAVTIIDALKAARAARGG